MYFDIRKFPGYGKLSGNTIKKLQAGKRISVREEKKGPLDFALWIENPNHLMQWESPWGRGYPGWHIECSAMSMAHLGETIDIHTGGEDNIFPHHECEIAQSEGATGKAFVNYWLHPRHLLVDGKKMSKSLGNFYTLRDLLGKGHGQREIRFLLLSANYRTRLNFTEKSLRQARSTVQSLDNFVSGLGSVGRGKQNKKVPGLVKKAREGFEEAMDDDLNISLALSHLFDLVGNINRLLERKAISKEDAKVVLDFVVDLDRVLGLELGKDVWASAGKAPAEIRKLIKERERLREGGDWEEADKIRDRLREMGIILEDTKEGPRWKRE